MITTTTTSVEGKRIVKYLGIVTGEAVISSKMFEDLFRTLKGIVGGDSKRFEQNLSRAKSIAIKHMRESAEQLGANAVIGVDLDYAALGTSETVLMVIANGTAVLLEERERE